MKRSISCSGLGLACCLCAVSAFAQEQGSQADTPAQGSRETAAPTAEPAQESSDASEGEKRFVLGVRLGYGIPLGTAAKDEAGSSAKLKDIISRQIPVWLDLGYMVTPRIMVGAYGMYGFGKAADLCVDGADCSVHVWRLGVQGQYHFSPGESFDPWLGLGVGYEFLSFNATADGINDDVRLKGWEFLNLQVGGDLKVAEGVGIGPFVSFSLNEYTKSTHNDVNEPLQKALHEWLTIGARGAFNL